MKRSEINDFIKNNCDMSYEELSNETGLSYDAVRKRYVGMKLPRKPKSNQNQHTVGKVDVKSGMEQRGDHIIINWTSKTVYTDLGEFDEMLVSFDMHKAIQRAYVKDHGNKTAAEVAVDFNFAHAKAVHLYARHHGFTKASLPQTDIEFESGLTEDEAVDENIQTMKRRVYKKTEKRKWLETERAAEKWWEFNAVVLKPLENHIKENLSTYKVPKLNLNKYKPGNYSAVVGISDIHYMKQCFDNTGKEIYNREIALRILKEHGELLVSRTLSHGIPDKFYVPVGNDNIHVDGINQMTTKGTIQANSTDGSFRIEVGNYIDMTIGMIDMFAQVAPVEVVNLFGNHDKHTSFLLQAFLAKYYEDSKRVTVRVNHHARTYVQYGENCLIFTHGDEMSLVKLQKSAHMLIMSEAKEQGIDPSKVQNWLLFTGHLHHDVITDLGGNLKHFIMPSFSQSDDWHQDSGFVGSRNESSMYLIDPVTGRKVIVYT